ncbi:hypothetical protein SEPCBS119000_000253 [Sporothrix epigloea]|uniref:Zn(2)-C6 fungal-type domain-containing protein n=1 Tax=Sporothrix epigloea TaxID=1892477 RepID=A0ABP0D438_9PEZI
MALDDREHMLNQASPNVTEPRTVPDLIVTTRRGREIWCTSPLGRSPRRSHSPRYPNLEDLVDGMQKRKRTPPLEQTAHRQEVPLMSSQQQQSVEADLPRMLTATEPETVAAAIAAASTALVSSCAITNHEPSSPRTPNESRDSDNLVRAIERTTTSSANEEHTQHHADMWDTQNARNDAQNGPSCDNVAYQQQLGITESPPDVMFTNNSCHQVEPALQTINSPLSDYGANSPEDEERPPIYGISMSPNSQTNGAHLQQTDPKRRKRNFSNRTKTGCLTCRKRKKKCDETKPECSNCVRGGFLCAGYPPQKGHWGKPDAARATIQIESRDPTYVAPGARGMPGALTRQQSVTFHPRRRESVSLYRGQSLRIETPQGRLLPPEDDHPSASSLPENLTSADSNSDNISTISAFAAPASVFLTPVSAATGTPFSGRTPNEYRRVPPLQEDFRLEANLESSRSSTTVPQINVYRSDSSPYRHPSPEESRQFAQPHDLLRSHSPWNEPQPQENEHEHDHESQQQVQEIQHTTQEPHLGHQLPSPQELNARPYPAHQADQPTPENRPQAPLHYVPRQGPLLRQDSVSTDRQLSIFRQFSPLSRLTPHYSREQRQFSRPFSDMYVGSECREAEELRAEARRNVPFFSTVPGTRREMKEMLAGRPFYQFDNQLVDARERCTAACWKYNNAMSPSVGVSQTERERLFKAILQPRHSEVHWPTGAVGEQVVVEAPFHADYGYNITIENAVHIGRNCHFSDALPINIGQRVTIGPNVSFYTAAPLTDPAKRDGVHSAFQGCEIVVEDDVFIGGNAVILGGSLPAFTVSYGSPAVVQRETPQDY